MQILRDWTQFWERRSYQTYRGHWILPNRVVYLEYQNIFDRLWNTQGVETEIILASGVCDLNPRYFVHF